MVGNDWLYIILNMLWYFHKVAFILKLIISLVVLRRYGKIIFDVSNKHGGVLPVSKLKKLQKLSMKVNKANLDINFFLNCRKLSIIPKSFLSKLPYTNKNNVKAFGNRLLGNALRKKIMKNSNWTKDQKTWKAT